MTYDEPSRCYLICVLFNNEEGVTIVVPDGPDLDEVFREILERNRGWSGRIEPSVGERRVAPPVH